MLSNLSSNTINNLNKKSLEKDDISIDSKSGYSELNHLKNLYIKTFISLFLYSTKQHRHVSEIKQEIKKLTNKNVNFTFNPHLIPTYRGILTSIYLKTKNKSAKNLRKELKKFYKKSKFIKILKLNSPVGSGNVIDTNNCEISICETRLKNKFVIFSTIDNLVKGASGQAIQNMNKLFNFKENLGLK